MQDDAPDDSDQYDLITGEVVANDKEEATK